MADTDTRNLHWKKNNGNAKSYTGPGWNYFKIKKGTPATYAIYSPGGHFAAYQMGSKVYDPTTGEVFVDGKGSAWDATYEFIRSFTELPEYETNQLDTPRLPGGGADLRFGAH